jgi:hypothetical protein
MSALNTLSVLSLFCSNEPTQLWTLNFSLRKWVYDLYLYTGFRDVILHVVL